MAASHQASMTFHGTTEVFQACLQAVPHCGFRVSGSNPDAGQISATSSMGMRSWGEKITITIGADGRVDIKSSCRGVQMVDYGKNKSNVNELLAAIGQFLPSTAP